MTLLPHLEPLAPPLLSEARARGVLGRPLPLVKAGPLRALQEEAAE